VVWCGVVWCGVVCTVHSQLGWAAVGLLGYWAAEKREERAEERGESRKERAERRKERGERREQRAERREARAESRKERGESREQKGENGWAHLQAAVILPNECVPLHSLTIQLGTRNHAQRE
jgi:hypothetical protein